MQSDSALALNHFAWCSEPKWHVDALRPPISPVCMVGAIASMRGKESALAFIRLVLGSAWRYSVQFSAELCKAERWGCAVGNGLDCLTFVDASLIKTDRAGDPGFNCGTSLHKDSIYCTPYCRVRETARQPVLLIVALFAYAFPNWVEGLLTHCHETSIAPSCSHGRRNR
jgi:hypothetical protein